MLKNIISSLKATVMNVRWNREQRRATKMISRLRINSYRDAQPGWVFVDKETEKSTCLARIGGSIWAEKPEYPVSIDVGGKLIVDRGAIAYGPVSTKVV